MLRINLSELSKPDLLTIEDFHPGVGGAILATCSGGGNPPLPALLGEGQQGGSGTQLGGGPDTVRAIPLCPVLLWPGGVLVDRPSGGAYPL